MISNEKLIEMYKNMCLVRYLDLKVAVWKLKGKIMGSMHIMSGQEAIGVGACAALEKNDYFVSTHRGHGHFIGKGIDIQRLAAEMCGKTTGFSRG